MLSQSKRRWGAFFRFDITADGRQWQSESTLAGIRFRLPDIAVVETAEFQISVFVATCSNLSTSRRTSYTFRSLYFLQLPLVFAAFVLGELVFLHRSNCQWHRRRVAWAVGQAGHVSIFRHLGVTRGHRETSGRGSGCDGWD